MKKKPKNRSFKMSTIIIAKLNPTRKSSKKLMKRKNIKVQKEG